MKNRVNRKNLADLGILSGCLAIYLFYAYFYSRDNLALIGSDLHPFFIIGILFSAYYGTKHAGVVSLLLSVIYIGLVYIQIDLLEEESLFSFKFIIFPINLTIFSLLVGEIRQRTWKKQVETKKKLSINEKILSDLEVNFKETEEELFEMKKRYATLTDSFRNNLNSIKSFEGLDLDGVVKRVSDILSTECDVHKIRFVSRKQSAENLADSEKNLILKVIDSGNVFTIKDEISSNDGVGDLEKLGFQIIFPFKVNELPVGFFFFGGMPFLSLNVYNQKKIANVLELAAISYAKSLAVEEVKGDSPFLFPYKVLKREYYAMELEGLVQAAREYDFPVNLAKLNFEINDSLSKSQREKILLLTVHLIKESRRGGEPIGLDLELGHIYICYLRIEEEARSAFELTYNRIIGIIPSSIKESISINFSFHCLKDIPIENFELGKAE
ncbi:MAG: hypothetical protein K9K67_07070 [Bacteriovoracaceae bacterium]|nr:hypothetical protein [Bacteriovoracaceae bacterium]